MEKTKKVTRYFSGPLMKQNIKSNWILCIAILAVMILMGNVMNYAESIMQSKTTDVDVTDYQTQFYTYLGAMATYNVISAQSGNETEELSYDDFIRNTNKNIYDTAFAVLNKQVKTDLSTEGFEASIAGLEQSGIKLETYVKEFEYSYALAQTKGVFSKGELTVEDMLDTTLELMGVDPTTVQKMSEMDTSAMLNQMYYTVAGLLPIFILIVILANSLIAEQVDRGSMAYVLSTPTKRSAVAITQMIFMIVVPLVIISIVGATRIGTSFLFYDEVNVPGLVALFAGMYLLIEAASAIGYFGSCLFSQSKKSMGFVGGLSTWFILSSLIGMFGAENMVNTGMGVEQLGIFNKLTIIGLYDIDTLATVGTSNVDFAFVWKLVVLAAIAVVCYIVGAIKFLKKDLPL